MLLLGYYQTLFITGTVCCLVLLLLFIFCIVFFWCCFILFGTVKIKYEIMISIVYLIDFVFMNNTQHLKHILPLIITKNMHVVKLF